MYSDTFFFEPHAPIRYQLQNTVRDKYDINRDTEISTLILQTLTTLKQTEETPHLNYSPLTCTSLALTNTTPTPSPSLVSSIKTITTELSQI